MLKAVRILLQSFSFSSIVLKLIYENSFRKIPQFSIFISPRIFICLNFHVIKNVCVCVNEGWLWKIIQTDEKLHFSLNWIHFSICLINSIFFFFLIYILISSKFVCMALNFIYNFSFLCFFAFNKNSKIINYKNDEIMEIKENVHFPLVQMDFVYNFWYEFVYSKTTRKQ